MKYATICSGIGCAELAADPLGWEPVFQSEIDPFASAVLAERFPLTPNFGDMTTISERIQNKKISLPMPDVLIAGTPCQAWSIAGDRDSLTDDRGVITLELIHILDAIDAQRTAEGKECCTLVWENVFGVFSTKDNAFGCFIGGLVGAEKPIQPFRNKKWPRAGMVRGPRRSLAWRILDAQYFGVPQHRRRVFIVAGAGADFDPSKVLFESESVRRDSAPRVDTPEDAAEYVSNGVGAGIAFGGNNQSGPIPVATARSAHGGPHGRLDFETETFLVHAYQQHGSDIGNMGCLRKGGEDSPQSAVPFIVTGGHVTHALNTANNGKHCSEDGTGRGVPLISTGMRVRRLTVVECERLQGLPDNFTLIRDTRTRKRLEDDYFTYLRAHMPDISRADAEVLAKDGPRYKAIGNGMAVPVISWLLKRMETYMKEIGR